MILSNFQITQKKIVSNASRKSFFFPSENLIFKKFKKLIIKKKNKSGRSSFGKIIFRTRTSFLIKKKYHSINYSLKVKVLGVVASFSFIPFKNKLLTLVFFSNGGVSYFLTTNNFVLFSFFYNKKLNLTSFSRFKFLSNYFLLFQIPKLSFVSFVELYPSKGAEYMRSPGSKAKILAFDKTRHSCLLKLPSGIKKIFSFYSFSFLGAISISNHKRAFSGKAGFWRKHGYKSTVRGVAMNAVDHPHGGRTKSIKTPLSPWGWVTRAK